MKKITRKDFLKVSGMSLGAAGLMMLTGCSESTTTSSSTETSTDAAEESASEAAEVTTDNTATGSGEKNGNVTMGPDSEQKTMVVVQSKSFETLDPFFASGTVHAQMRTVAWDTLWDMELGADQEVGLCAKEWTFSEDTKTVYVTIYDNIHDSENNPITAHDFEWFYNTYNENKTFGSIISLVATGDYTLEIELKYAYYPGYLFSATMDLVACAEVAYNAETFVGSPVTSGQYAPVAFTSGASATFMQTYNYWGDTENLTAQRHANVDVIRFEVITENSQIETALQTNSIQVGDVTASIAEDLENTETVKVQLFNESYPAVFMLNNAEGSVFAGNKELREAIAYAIDYESMCYVATLGNGTVTGIMGNASLSGYSEDFVEYAYSYDLDMAKQKLADAGYSEGDLSLVYVTNVDNEVGTILENCMSALGIDLTIQLTDETAFLTTRQQANLLEWDILYLGTVPNGYFTTLMYWLANTSSFDFGNYSGAMDQELSDLVTTARYSQDPDDIETAYAALMDRLYYLPTWEDYGYAGCYYKIESVVKTSTLATTAQASVFADDYDVYWDGK